MATGSRLQVQPSQEAYGFDEGEIALRAELRVPQSGKLVAGMRFDMLGRGFTLVNTPDFFGAVPLYGLKRCTALVPFHGQRWEKFPQLVRYGRWLERLLAEALPGESLSLEGLELRFERAGSTNQEVDGLHADGGYVRSVYSLYGAATIFRHAKVETDVPAGQTLVMTAQNRTRALRLPCTLHRRPGPGPERAVIVCSFGPSGQQAWSASSSFREAERSQGSVA